jgi:hypothetical protein
MAGFAQLRHGVIEHEPALQRIQNNSTKPTTLPRHWNQLLDIFANLTYRSPRILCNRQSTRSSPIRQ